jgi:hypothetical protein
MTADDSFGRLDDDYPGCTMGRAAEMCTASDAAH